MSVLCLFMLVIALPITAMASLIDAVALPPLRLQNEIQNKWIEERTFKIIPSLLEEFNVDAWIVSQREYGEDPVFLGLNPRSTVFAARRRTTYIFGRNETGDFIHQTFIFNTPDVWDDILHTLEALVPRRIALNMDPVSAFADGLHVGELEQILTRLPLKFSSLVTSVPLLPIKFIATRVDGMLPYYRDIMTTAHTIIKHGFSGAVIKPGETSCADLEWFFRDQIQAHNMTTWFHPNVDLTRPGKDRSITLRGESAIIEKGDLLWVDFGVTAMGLNTDTQHMAYVLRDGEFEPPVGLQKGLIENSNIMQDFLLEEIRPGRTGNEILKTVLKRIREAHINGTVYCHPIGDFGHSAGTLIGMTNLQDGVPVLGDIPVFENMWFSIELQSNVRIPEWDNQWANFRQEEDAFIDADGKIQWVIGRQTKLHLVKAFYDPLVVQF